MKPLLLILLLAAGWSDVRAECSAWCYSSQALIIADWSQTLQIADNPDEYYEMNPILGKHPTRGEVNTYFAGALVANYYVGQWLGDRWFIGVTVLQGAVVTHNYGLGLTIGF